MSTNQHTILSRLPACAVSFAIAVSAAAARADSLAAGFHDPPDSARPQVWWHWMNGNVTRVGITADLEAMKRVGIGGAEIFNVDCGIPAGPVKFNSPKWHSLMKLAAQEAHRLSLQLQIHNCAGWSSSGGPWNTPRHAMQRLTTSTRRVKGPEHFAGRLPQPPAKLGFYRDVAVLAFRTPDNEIVRHDAIVNLTRRLKSGGELDWEVPAGDWTLLRIGYTPTGQENHPAPPEGTGLECDKFSTEALDAHWNGFVQKVLDDLGPLAGAGRTLDGVVIDSYEVGGQDWTLKFREDFERRRGYDPLPYLPAITGRVVDNPEVTRRFLWDMRRTIADLFAENYYGHFQELCHRHGLKASIEPYTGPFESLQCGAAADIPMGEFWVGSAPNASVKLASSVGHIYGRRIIGAESFTAAPGPKHGRWLDDAYSLKALGDLVFCQGVNRFILHRFAMQPWTNRWPGMTMGQWGTHFDRTSTWWEQGRAWLHYVTRCQFLLQQGRFVADAAYFCGESAPVELRAGAPPLPPGYDYDGINTDVLLNRASVQDHQLVLKSGMRYRVLILPPSDRDLTPALLRKLRGFVAAGLTLVGAPPKASPSLQDYPRCDREVRKLAAELWGDCNGTTVTSHAFGKGQVVWGESLDKVFAGLGVPPDFEYRSRSDAKLAYIHRLDGGTDVYFVSNQRHHFDEADCTFRVGDKAPELWNARTGRIEPAPIWQEQAGRTTVHLQFDPAGSVFVVFRSRARGDHLVAVQRKGPSVGKQPMPAVLCILKAAYGVFPSSLDVTANVQALVAGGQRHIPASNTMAGEDPSPGLVKRLRVEFVVQGRHQTAEATEGNSVDLPAGSKVLHAIYGNLPGSKPGWFDVTAIVRRLVAGGTNQIPAGNELAGTDPAPNIMKQLRVEFRRNGRLQSAEATEGGILVLPAHAQVVEARYGASARNSVAGSAQTIDLTAKLAALVKDGELNVQIDNTLAGRDPAPQLPKELRVTYSLGGVVRQTVVPENDSLSLPENPSPGAPPPFVVTSDEAGQPHLWTRAPGDFTLTWASGRKTEAHCASVPALLRVTGPWTVHFPPGWRAPAEVRLDHLESWTKNSDPGVKYFSGTATYARQIEIPGSLIAPGRELWLDLGAVKNFAEVSLNGQSLGILWKPPFRVDVTRAARSGKNELQIRITNLWPNRLIGDEQLPPDCQWIGKRLKEWPSWLLAGKPSPTGRVTFTTWHHWTKDDPLLDSGLLGPVTLQVAEELAVH